MGNEIKEDLTGGRTIGGRIVGKERIGSMGVVKMWKKKRELKAGGEEEERMERKEESGVLQRSKKTAKLSVEIAEGRELEMMGTMKR